MSVVALDVGHIAFTRPVAGSRLHRFDAYIHPELHAQYTSGQTDGAIAPPRVTPADEEDVIDSHI